MCSCRPRLRSSTRTSTRSTPRWSSGTTRGSRAPGDRRRRGGAGGELRGQGVRRPNSDGRLAGEAAVPARDRGAAADLGVQRGEQGGVRGVRGDGAARRGAVDRRGLPRRPRARSHLRHAGRDRGPSCGARCGARSVCRSPSGSRAPSSSPRSRAAWRSPTGCCSCRSTESSRSCIRSRSSAYGASAGRPRGSCATGITTVGDVAALTEGALGRCSAGAPAGTSTRSRTTTTRGRWGGGGAAARSAPSERSRGRSAPGHVRAGRARRPRDPPDAHRRTRVPDRRPPAALR